MSDPNPKREPRARSTLAFVGYLIALVLTLWALLLNNITLAGDYTLVLVQAIGSSVVAILLLVLCWTRIPTPGRVVSAVLVLANLWVLVDAGGRRLPAALGW